MTDFWPGVLTGLLAGEGLEQADAADAMRRVCEKVRADVHVHGMRSALADWATWSGHERDLIDEALGLSGASAAGRAGFAGLAARVGMGRSGSCCRWRSPG